MITTDVQQRRIDHLNLLTLGDPDHPPLVMVHGIRDVAWSLVPVAQRLANQYYVILPDLRGHGDSEKPGNYAMHQFIFDLENLLEQLNLSDVALLGHSLGGHIVIRTTAMYPDRISRLIVVEGLGPPARPFDSSFETQLKFHADRLRQEMKLHRRLRSLPSHAFAVERIIANNPRIAPEFARWLVQKSTELVEGELFWKFDARVSQLWLSDPGDDSRQYYQQVKCPTLIVNADLACDYWTRQMPIPGWDGRYSDAELAEKTGSFPLGSLIHLPQAGHMVHYDAAPELAREVQEFLDSVNLA